MKMETSQSPPRLHKQTSKETSEVPASNTAIRKWIVLAGLILAFVTCASQIGLGWKTIRNDRASAAIKSWKHATTITNNLNSSFKPENMFPTGEQQQQNLEITGPSKTTSQQRRSIFPPGFLPKTSIYNHIHEANQPVLDLLSWEEASLQGLATANFTHFGQTGNSCHPPPGVSRTCCLGTFSSGGGVDPRFRNKCAQAFHGPGNQWAQLKHEVHRFFAHNKFDRGSGGMQCDVCQIIELSRLHSLNISLIGDSMHSQVFGGMLCELQRRGYMVEKQRITPEYTGKWSRYQNFIEHFAVRVRSPTWAGSAQSITVAFHMLYMLPFQHHSIGAMTNILSTSHVLLLGMGLHWKHGFNEGANSDFQAYPRAMGEFFHKALAQNSSVELLVERETTAQHFDVPGGDYRAWSKQENASDRCVNRFGAATYWRERVLDNATTKAQHGYERVVAGPDMPADIQSREVLAIPYHNFTQLFHTMHPMYPKHQDCTHYCSSPFMYMTLWRSLRLAMDRRYRNVDVDVDVAVR